MKDYEIDFSKTAINFRFIGIILISLIVVAFMFAPILAAKPTTKNPAKFNDTNRTIIQYVTVLVTPTPDGITYFAQEYQNGVRKINHPFSFTRFNASGYQTLKITATVYGYSTFNILHWHNDDDQHDYSIVPPTGMKYLFVYYNMYLDDRIGMDAQFYIPNINNYVVQIDGDPVPYYPLTTYPQQLWFLELGSTHTMDDTSIIQAFGQQRVYQPDYTNPTANGGFVSANKSWIRGGISNAPDGYLLYQIPAQTTDEQLSAGVNFGSFGDSWWRLKP